MPSAAESDVAFEHYTVPLSLCFLPDFLTKNQLPGTLHQPSLICLLFGPRFPKCWACLWHTEHCSPLVLFLPLKHNSNCSCQRLQLCPSAHLLWSPTWPAVGLFLFVLNTATSSDIIDSPSLLVTFRLLCWRLSVVEVCPVPTVSWTHSVFERVQP